MSGGNVQNPPWRHHYLPEFYLKRWAVDGKLVQFSKPWGNTVKPKRCSPRETGFADAREELKDLPLEAKAMMEQKLLSPVDHLASQVLEKFEAAAPSITIDERVAWAQFLMSICFRNPEYVRDIRKRLFDSVQITTPSSERHWRKNRRAGAPKTLAEAMRQEVNDRPAELSRETLKLAGEMMGSARIAMRLVNMKWGSFQTHSLLPALLTSDRPVQWINSLADEDCHIIMPIGPKRIFWAVKSQQMALTMQAADRERIIEFVNDYAVRRAVKYVYAMSDSHLAYVQRTMGVDPPVLTPDLFTVDTPASQIAKEKAAVERRKLRR